MFQDKPYSTTTFIRRVLGLLLVSTALVVGCGDTTESNGSDDDSESENAQARKELPNNCRGGCPDGQFCFNGVCAIGCNSDQDCAENQYCATDTDGLCHNTEVPTCTSDGDCAEDQVCTKGVCGAPAEEESECEPSADGEDGCGRYAVCVERDEGNTCHTLPRCGQDGSCPTGQAGAVCNEEYIPNKAEICLIGLCESSDDCPSEWSCMKAFEGQTLGFCKPGSDGGQGSTCQEDSDCDSGSCFGATSNAPGACE